jgi:hypothetical protein
VSTVQVYRNDNIKTLKLLVTNENEKIIINQSASVFIEESTETRHMKLF